MNANTSATAMAHQMPSMPKNMGSTSTQSIWNTSVRKNDTMADTAPLLSAVKNEDT